MHLLGASDKTLSHNEMWEDYPLPEKLLEINSSPPVLLAGGQFPLTCSEVGCMLSPILYFSSSCQNLLHNWFYGCSRDLETAYLELFHFKLLRNSTVKKKMYSRDYFPKTCSTGGAVCCKTEFRNEIRMIRCLLNPFWSCREYYTCSKQVFSSFRMNLSAVALDWDKKSKSQTGLLRFLVCVVSGQKSSKLCSTLP